MKELFSAEVSALADAMGVSLYQCFSIQEAALFLRCSFDAIEQLIAKQKIGYLAVADGEITFFGYQLVQHLNEAIQPVSMRSATIAESFQNDARVLRTKDVQALTSLSRSTIWRLEKKGQFPRHIMLGEASIGWLKQDVMEWLEKRKVQSN